MKNRKENAKSELNAIFESWDASRTKLPKASDDPKRKKGLRSFLNFGNSGKAKTTAAATSAIHKEAKTAKNTATETFQASGAKPEIVTTTAVEAVSTATREAKTAINTATETFQAPGAKPEPLTQSKVTIGAKAKATAKSTENATENAKAGAKAKNKTKGKSQLTNLLSETAKYRRRQKIVVAFFTPMLLYFFFYALKGIFPFGNGMMLSLDLYFQYTPFMAELRNKIFSFELPFFSWHGGFGINFFPVWTYYLLSPLNFIAILVPYRFLAEAMFVIIGVKIGLMGAAACWLLEDGFAQRQTAKAPQEIASFFGKADVRKFSSISIVLSTFYALSNFVISFSSNIMWMDSLIFCPLILLGIIKFMRDGKKRMFFFATAFCVLINFYSAYFVGLFAILFTFVAMVQFAPQGFWPRVKKLLTLLGMALLAVALAGVVIYPTVKALADTSALGNVSPGLNAFEDKLLELFSGVEIISRPSVFYGSPNIYAGILTVALLPSFFLSARRKLNVKISYLLLLLFILLSFYYKPLDYIWQGFHYSQGFVYRFAFVFVLLVLIMAYQVLREDEVHIPSVALTALVMLILMTTRLQPENDKPDDMRHWRIILTILLFVLYILILSVINKQKQTSLYQRLLTGVLVIELLLNSFFAVHYISGGGTTLPNRDNYVAGSTARDIRKLLDTATKKADGKFYRAYIKNEFTQNSGFLFGFNGCSVFSSTFPQKPLRFMSELGFGSNYLNSLMYDDSTQFMDDLLGVRFVIAPQNSPFVEKRRTMIATAGDFALYENTEALPFGCYLPETAAKADFATREMAASPFQTQNFLSSDVLGLEYWNIFEQYMMPAPQGVPMEQIKDMNGNPTNTFKFKAAENGDTWCCFKANIDVAGNHYLSFEGVNLWVFSVNGYLNNQQKFFSKIAPKGIIDLGYLDAGTEVLFRMDIGKEAKEGMLHVSLGRLNEESHNITVSKLKTRAFNLHNITSGSFSGTIEAPDAGHLFLPIFKTDGWTYEVNGKKVEAETLRDAFVLLPLEKGKNTVRASFVPPGLLEGGIISLCAALLLLLWYFLAKSKNKGTFKNLKGRVNPENAIMEAKADIIPRRKREAE